MMKGAIMKRIGFLYEKFLSLNNFIKAEALLRKNKPKNKKAKHISANADKYGAELLEEYKQAYVYPNISKGACISIISKQSKIKSLA